VNRLPIADVLRAALIAAIVAGGIAAVFHLGLSDRTVDRAIAIEQAKHPDEDHGQAVFSRGTQKAGLVAGTLTYALGMGLIVGGVFALLSGRLPGRSLRTRSLILLGAGVWVLYLAPFIKYPAFPPGAGDPATIYYRQALYLACVLLTGLGLIPAKQLLDSLLQSGRRPAFAVAAAVGVYAAYCVLLFFVLPRNPDRNDVPSGLLLEFRAFSLAGGFIFWLLFGGIFAELLARAERTRLGPEVTAPSAVP
jgi:predicted cobalt transporter CbtA